MAPERAKALVYVHTNLRLLSQSTSQYNEGERKMWNLEGDGFGTFEGHGILEVANLPINEPELEVVLFMDGDEDEAIGVGSN